MLSSIVCSTPCVKEIWVFETIGVAEGKTHGGLFPCTRSVRDWLAYHKSNEKLSSKKGTSELLNLVSDHLTTSDN